MSTRLRLTAIVLCLAALCLAEVGFTQGPRRAGRRAGGVQQPMDQVDPAAMRVRMMQRMQQQLEASDAEWQVIQPRLQKVMELTRQTNRRGLGTLQARPDGRRNPDRASRRPRAEARQARPDTDRTPSAVEKTATELRELLTDTSATNEQIEAKVKALRTARQAAQQELAQARRSLQEVLTVKQEARLVLVGLLE